MIKYNPLFKNDGTLNGALSTAPSDSIVFDLPGKCIWVKGVKLKGTDTTYTFSHDNYITLTNTPGDPEDIKIGVNTTALKNAIDTTYGIVSATVDGLAPKYNTTNKGETDFYSSVYCLGVAGSTLKWYQIPHRTVRINNDTNDKLTSNDGEPLRISAGTNIGVTWNSTTKSIVISNTATIPENTDSNVAQYLASDDKNYRILFKGTLNDDNVIWSTRFSSTLLYNPSTKVLSVNGNAVLHAGNVNSANATIGTSLTTIATIGGVDIKAQISNTDFKVKQTVTTTNSDYRVLLKKTANDTEETDSSNFASTLLYNPSTKILKINGNRMVTFADTYVGATSSADATTGLVPVASSANRNKFLRGDGTWLTIVQENTWRPIKVGGSEKLSSGTDTGAVDFVAGTGITLGWDATNKKITITNSAPDQNHNTDRTGIKLGTVSGTKKTDNTVILANSTVGLTIAGGTNKFSIGDGTNYIEVPITINHGLSTKNITINGTAYAIYTSASSLPTFVAPGSYAGTGGYILATNSAKNGLEWVAKPVSNVTTTAVVAASATGTSQITSAQTNPYYNLLEGGAVSRSIRFVAGTGITISAATNGQITITNTSPDQNHNTDRTSIKLAAVSGTKKTDSTLILANSGVGLSIAGGTNLIKIGDGTNYIEVPITINHGLSTKNMTINGTAYALYTSASSLPTFVAPGAYGTANYILATNSSGNGLTWVAKPTSNVTTTAIVGNSATATSQITAAQTNPYYNLLEGGAVTRSIRFVAGNGITISAATDGLITITNSKPDVNHDTHYVTTMYIGESNDTKSNVVATNPYLKLFDNNTRRSTLRFVAGNGIIIGSDASGNITITNSKPDVNHDTHYTTTMFAGANNDTKANAVATNPYLKLFDNNARRSTLRFVAGTGITIASDANGNITVTNASPDVNHNTDRTGVKLGTVSGTQKTDSTLIIANSGTGLVFQGGTNLFKIGDGTNYIQVPITPSFTVTDKSANILTSLTTLATIAGTDIKAKVTVVDSSPTLTTSLQTIATIAGVEIKAKITNYNTDEKVRQVPKTDNVNRPLMMINGGTSQGEQVNTSMFSTGIYANASSKMITANGFIKAGSDDTYILLGGGGHKLLTGLLTAASLGASGNSTTLSVTVGGTTKTGSVTVPYATSAGNADTVDNIHANGLLTATSLGTSGNSTTLSVTVGGTTKTGSVTVPYAKLAGTVTVNNSDSNSTYRMVWHSGNTLYSTGGIYCNPSTDCIYASHYYETSDRAKKTNIEYFSEHIRKFTLKASGKTAYGVIAQEVAEMFREGEDGNMTVNYSSVLSYYIGALENRIKVLEDEINKLKNK